MLQCVAACCSALICLEVPSIVMGMLQCVRLRRREGEWGEGPSLAITASKAKAQGRGMG